MSINAPIPGAVLGFAQTIRLHLERLKPADLKVQFCNLGAIGKEHSIDASEDFVHLLLPTSRRLGWSFHSEQAPQRLLKLQRGALSFARGV
jgi:hypothetical protein